MHTVKKKCLKKREPIRKGGGAQAPTPARPLHDPCTCTRVYIRMRITISHKQIKSYWTVKGDAKNERKQLIVQYNQTLSSKAVYVSVH